MIVGSFANTAGGWVSQATEGSGSTMKADWNSELYAIPGCIKKLALFRNKTNLYN
jgi:hypothetical protein